MAAMAQMQNALRAEIRDLKVKIVSLETAEADNFRLRKELSSIQTTFEHEKAQQELVFVSRLADIKRENNAKVADLKAKLAQPKSQLAYEHHAITECNGIQLQREKTQIIDRNRDELAVLQHQLLVVQTKRDELTRKLEEACVELELKDRKLESLGVDASFDETSQSSDQRGSTECLSLQLKLREANEEIARRQTGTSKHASTPSHIDGQQQRRAEQLERENLRLQNALKAAEQDRKKHDITVIQLERRNHDLKMCIQKLEIQGQNDETDTRSSYGFTEVGNLEVECQRLQSELRKTKNSLSMANLKQEELNYELRKSTTANVECGPEVDMLQQNNQTLQLACEELGGEVGELKKQLLSSNERNNSLMKEIIDIKNLLQSSEQDKMKLSEQLVQSETEIREHRASEVDSPQNQASILIDTSETEEDATHEILKKLREENRKLNLDVNQLQRKLDDERKNTRGLRIQIGDFGTSDLAPFVSSSPSKTATLKRKSKPTGNSSTRGSVKGIAARFENGGIQAHSEEKVPLRTSFNKRDIERTGPRISPSKQPTEPSDEVNSLKSELDRERRQIFELDEELTRQCEINGSLLQEIDELSLEIEAERKENANHFKISLQRKKDQEEIAELRSHLTSLSQELTVVSKERADLDSKHQICNDKIISLQDQVNEKNNDLKKTHSRDKEIILHLEEKVISLEKDLTKTLTLVEDLRDKLNSHEDRHSSDQHVDVQSLKSTLDEKDKKLILLEREKEQIILGMKVMTGFKKQEMEGLLIELARLKSKNTEQSREKEFLRDKLEQRNCNLQSVENNVETSTSNLRAENSDLRQKLIEATSERQTAEAKLKQYLNERGGSSKSVQILRERNAALKFKVEKLTKKLSKLDGDKMQVTRVMI